MPKTRKYVITREVCLRCNCIIDTGELCSYGCDLDGAMYRPKGSVAKRTYQVEETLINEEIR